ncbi:MAG: LacI family transcriptional regulator [Planctomycetes bacterium]|nr:LacI family transcriptional regulator [Planctomycetota bacterium]
MPRVTIYDIAEEVGVSTATVSRVLNGSALIAPQTARAIRDAARRLGYRKRTIRRQRGRAILHIRLILPRRAERVQKLFYDYADLLAGIKAGVQDNRVNVVTDVEGESLDLFGHKKGGDVDGVIFAFTRPAESVYDQLARRGVPALTLHRLVEGRDYITCDNAEGMRRLVAELVAARGDHREPLRPCYVRLEPIRDIADDRQRGVVEGCRQARIRFTRRDVIAIEAIADVDRRLVDRVDRGGYNAVLCFNDVVAAAFCQAAGAAGADPARRWAVTGFDNSPLRDLMRPRPATISLPVQTLGEQAGRWIRRRIVERSDEPFTVRLPGEYLAGDRDDDQ